MSPAGSRCRGRSLCTSQGPFAPSSICSQVSSAGGAGREVRCDATAVCCARCRYVLQCCFSCLPSCPVLSRALLRSSDGSRGSPHPSAHTGGVAAATAGSGAGHDAWGAAAAHRQRFQTLPPVKSGSYHSAAGPGAGGGGPGSGSDSPTTADTAGAGSGGSCTTSAATDIPGADAAGPAAAAAAAHAGGGSHGEAAAACDGRACSGSAACCCRSHYAWRRHRQRVAIACHARLCRLLILPSSSARHNSVLVSTPSAPPSHTSAPHCRPSFACLKRSSAHRPVRLPFIGPASPLFVQASL